MSSRSRASAGIRSQSPGSTTGYTFAQKILLGLTLFTCIFWIVFFPLYFTYVETGKSSVVTTGTAKFQSSKLTTERYAVPGVNRELKISFNECEPASAAMQAQYNLSSTHIVCPEEPEDWDTVTREHKFHAVVHDSTTNAPSFVFVPRSANDIVAQLDNVSGKFFSCYLQFATDMWSEGFDPSTNDGDMTALVATMKTLAADGIPIIGGEAAPDNCDLNDAFDFDAKNPISVPMTKVTATNLTTVSGELLKGVLRFSTAYVDYHFQLNSIEHKVRVMLGDCEGRMGDKMIFVDGAFQWLDISDRKNPVFVKERNDNVLTFWNMRLIEEDLGVESSHGGPEGSEQGSPEQEDFEAKDEAMRLALTGAFQDLRLGMPIELSADTFDFTVFTQENKTLTIDLIVDGQVGFRSDGSLSEADLATQPIEIVKRFDIPGLNFRASINVV